MTERKSQPALPRMTKPLWGWAIYDFANSAYTTLIVTFLYSGFFMKGIAEDETIGTVQWANAVVLTAILVAVLSPLLGAIADQGGHRRRFLFGFTGAAVLTSALLYFPTKGEVLFALTLFVASNVAFEMANVFYNSYLPDLAERSKIGRISGYGWALGYVGGLIAMGVALVTMVGDAPWFGLSTENAQNYRAIPVLVAVWYAVFSIPMFLWVKDAPAPGRPVGEVVGGAFRQLTDTFHDLKRYKQVVRMLIARMLYNDGIVTIFAFGSIYAIHTFGFTIEEVMLWGLALNVSAAIGALAMGFLDDKIGGKKTVQITNVCLAVMVLFLALAQTKTSMWIGGIILGLFVGPNQSASRSLLGRFVPESRETEFFGFFAFSGKATAFIGPWILGRMVDLTGSQRYGVFAILILFVLGGALLTGVDEEEGIRGATRVV
jgi:MFS transporter, UMF1 family